MSEDYWKCPVSFQENCFFHKVRCSECAAYSEDNGSELLYKPTSSKVPGLSFKDHPYIAFKIQARKKQKEQARREKTQAKKSQEFQKKRQVVRAGLKTEKKVLNKISAKSTLASGRINGDADGVKEIIKDLKLGIEHKTRFNGQHLLGPTLKEWETAQNQGAKVFIVTSKEEGSIVTMSIDTFNQLIEIIENLNTEEE